MVYTKHQTITKEIVVFSCSVKHVLKLYVANVIYWTPFNVFGLPATNIFCKCIFFKNLKSCSLNQETICAAALFCDFLSSSISSLTFAASCYCCSGFQFWKLSFETHASFSFVFLYAAAIFLLSFVLLLFLVKAAAAI